MVLMLVTTAKQFATNNPFRIVNSLISGIYDIYNNTIVDLSLSITNSERKIYINQFHNLHLSRERFVAICEANVANKKMI